MLAMVDENPAYSRIDGYNYITCLVCDSQLRNALKIPHDSIKILGNIVGASSRPIHQANLNGTNQTRNFGTNQPQNPPPTNNSTSQNRRNWFSDNNDVNNQPPAAPPRWGNQSTSSGNQNRNNNNWNNNQAKQRPTTSSVKCECHEPAMRLVCKKDGPNQNRPFLKCAKGTCKFFQWDDQAGGNARNNDSGGARAPRKCGICRLTGHTRSNCPNNN